MPRRRRPAAATAAALLLLLAAAACAPQSPPAADGAPPPGTVLIPAPGVLLRATFDLPPNPAATAILALHGCGGPFASRDAQWKDLFVQAGHPVLFPDSFGSRGLRSQCRNPARAVSPNGARKDDAAAAAAWLAARPGVPAGGSVVVGWSNGGSTVLALAAAPLPPGLVRGFVAFYPGCAFYARRPGWAPSAPLLILMGADDDWTPAAPCRELAARFPQRITLQLYPGAFHDFDAPARPVRAVHGLAFTAGGTGTAHAGTNEPARADAMARVPAWIAALPPVPAPP